MNPERLARFREVVGTLSGSLDVVIAQMDPDALGAAFGVSLVLRRISDVTPRIVYSGSIGHPQNRAMVNLYGLREVLVRMEDMDDPPGRCVLVDSSRARDNRLPEGVELDPVLVIDHHRGSDPEREGTFVWVEDVGSASTLVTELIRACDLEFDDGPEPALLAMGIYTDTKALVRAGSRDRDAYGYVTASVEARELQRLIDYPLPESHFENLTRALDRYHQRGGRLVADVGTIAPEDGDDLSTIADYFLRKDGVTLVVVWGIVGGVVRLSARSADLSTPLDEFLRARFGDAAGAKLSPDGRGEGGARLRLDMGPWLSDSTQKEIEAVVRKRIEGWIFES